MIIKYLFPCLGNLVVFALSLSLFLPMLTQESEVPLQEGCALIGSVLFFEGLRKTWKLVAPLIDKPARRADNARP